MKPFIINHKQTLSEKLYRKKHGHRKDSVIFFLNTDCTEKCDKEESSCLEILEMEDKCHRKLFTRFGFTNI